MQIRIQEKDILYIKNPHGAQMLCRRPDNGRSHECVEHVAGLSVTLVSRGRTEIKLC